MFDWLNKGLGIVIRFCSSIVNNNYAIALLLFALIVKIVLFPLGIKQQKNMVVQAKLRPREMAIRKKYAGRNDRATQQKMQEEVMALYQEEKYNPMSGCLPLLIQLPILFALYEVIRRPLTYICQFKDTVLLEINKILTEINLGVTVKGDLTDANILKAIKADEINFISKMNDSAAGLDKFSAIEGFNANSIPDFEFLGLDLAQIPSKLFWPLILIPVLNFVFTFISSKVTKKLSYQAPSTQDAANSGSMKIMEYSMPLLSTYIAYIMPASLGLYWIFQNLLSMLQQFILYKMYPYPKFTEEDYKAAEKAITGSKQSKKKDVDPNRPKVRSLHHIDDDEFEEIYGKKKKESSGDTAGKKKETTPEEVKEENTETEEQTVKEEKDIPVIKDDEKTKYKKKD